MSTEESESGATEEKAKAKEAETEEAEARSESSVPSERPRKAKKKKAKRPKLPIPETEEEIDSPNRQTLGMLGVLCGLTLILWGFAHGACNYHPPKETRRPRQVPTAELAREPKDAAIELVHRWATLNLAGALELAKGSLSDEIAKDKASCDQNAADCKRKSAELDKTVLTSAVLLEREPQTAAARVTVRGLDGGPKNYIVQLERDASYWKATSRAVDDGTYKVKPAAPVGMLSPMMMQPRPAGSGAVPPSMPPGHGPGDGHGH
jgi:hypothetical protein